MFDIFDSNSFYLYFKKYDKNKTQPIKKYTRNFF